MPKRQFTCRRTSRSDKSRRTTLDSWDLHWKPAAMVIGEQVEAITELAQIADAGYLSSTRFRPPKGRKQHGRKHGNDGDHDQKLN